MTTRSPSKTTAYALSLKRVFQTSIKDRETLIQLQIFKDHQRLIERFALSERSRAATHTAKCLATSARRILLVAGTVILKLRLRSLTWASGRERQ